MGAPFESERENVLDAADLLLEDLPVDGKVGASLASDQSHLRRLLVSWWNNQIIDTRTYHLILSIIMIWQLHDPCDRWHRWQPIKYMHLIPLRYLAFLLLFLQLLGDTLLTIWRHQPLSFINWWVLLVDWVKNWRELQKVLIIEVWRDEYEEFLGVAAGITDLKLWSGRLLERGDCDTGGNDVWLNRLGAVWDMRRDHVHFYEVDSGNIEISLIKPKVYNVLWLILHHNQQSIVWQSLKPRTAIKSQLKTLLVNRVFYS